LISNFGTKKTTIVKYDKKNRICCIYEPSIKTTYVYRYIKNNRITEIKSVNNPTNYYSIIKESSKNGKYINEYRMDDGERYKTEVFYNNIGREILYKRKNKRKNTFFIEMTLRDVYGSEYFSIRKNEKGEISPKMFKIKRQIIDNLMKNT